MDRGGRMIWYVYEMEEGRKTGCERGVFFTFLTQGDGAYTFVVDQLQ